MEIKKILKRGDKLQVSLLELNVGESIKVPYRHYSENSIRSTVTQLKRKDKNPLDFEINAKSNTTAILTRIQ